MDRLSNAERVSRSNDEGRVAERDKKAKKTTEIPPRPSLPRSVRMKIVWEVCSGTGKTVKTFQYADKASAEAQTKALTRSTGRAHVLRQARVPMD